MEEPEYYILDGFEVHCKFSEGLMTIEALELSTRFKYHKSIDDTTSMLISKNYCKDAKSLSLLVKDAFHEKKYCKDISIGPNARVKLFLKNSAGEYLNIIITLDKATCNIPVSLNQNSHSSNSVGKIPLAEEREIKMRYEAELHSLDNKYDRLEQKVKSLENTLSSISERNTFSMNSLSNLSTENYSPLIASRRKTSEKKVETSISNYEKELLTFDSDLPNMKYFTLFNSGKTLTRIWNDKHWEKITCSNFLREKYELISFKINQSPEKYIMIGLCPSFYHSQKTCFDKSGSLFFYCFNGTIYRDGSVFATLSQDVKIGDVITIFIDIGDSVVCFLQNGNLIYSQLFPGVSKSNIKYYPAVETFNINDSVTIVQYS